MPGMTHTNETTPHGRLGRLAEVTYRRRGRVVAAWVVGLIAVIALTPLIAGEYEADFGTNGSESERATTLIEEHFPGRTGDTVNVVWKANRGVDDPAVTRTVDNFVTRAEKLEGVGDAGPTRVSRDGRIATLSLELSERGFIVPVDTGKDLIKLAEDATGDGMTLAVAGGPVQEAEEGGAPEAVGLVAAAVVLLIAFGSIVAAGLPLAVALFGLGISASLIGVLAAVMDVPDFAPAVAGLIGIGVGIDYALLVLTRFRAELAERGGDVRGSIVEAVGTAGRSVLVAGTTVLISVNGLFLMGVSYLQGVALSASLSVLVVMIAAVTLLPALLSFAGHRVDRLRIPGMGGMLHRSDDKPTLAERWSLGVQRRPVVAAVVGAVIVIGLTAPALGLRLGFPDDGNAPKDSILRTAYDLTAEGFGPGANGPLVLATELPAGRDSGATLQRLANDVRRDPNVAFVSPPQRSPDGQAAIVVVAPRTTPQAQDTEDLVTRLRADTIPAAVAGTGVTAHLGGLTAAFEDQSELVSDRLPLFIGGVVGMSLLLLLSAFRSPVIAIKAGVMNLLSVGAAYGVIALFAEGGFFGQLIGIDTETPVAPFIPVMMFAILFGLSMDYEVFLLSRVREEFQKHGNTTRAVADGLARTARVITAAAAIMVVVFLAFITSSESFLKLLGIGMATAIFVDATIIRMVLVPSIMQLMGRANWWMPRWLDRAVPRLDPHPAEAAPAAAR